MTQRHKALSPKARHEKMIPSRLARQPILRDQAPTCCACRSALLFSSFSVLACTREGAREGREKKRVEKSKGASKWQEGARKRVQPRQAYGRGLRALWPRPPLSRGSGCCGRSVHTLSIHRYHIMTKQPLQSHLENAAPALGAVAARGQPRRRRRRRSRRVRRRRQHGVGFALQLRNLEGGVRRARRLARRNQDAEANAEDESMPKLNQAIAERQYVNTPQYSPSHLVGQPLATQGHINTYPNTEHYTAQSARHNPEPHWSATRSSCARRR
jgi:hypothetical protein